MTFEEWYAREGNHKVVEKQNWWKSEDVKKMLEASWTTAYEINNIEKDAIINFLKKEVQKKSSYKNVMKRQYRELKQKYDAVVPKERLLNITLTPIAEFSVQGWTDKEKQELLDKWKEINNRKK